jgi:hypothetical protein
MLVFSSWSGNSAFLQMESWYILDDDISWVMGKIFHIGRLIFDTVDNIAEDSCNCERFGTLNVFRPANICILWIWPI